MVDALVTPAVPKRHVGIARARVLLRSARARSWCVFAGALGAALLIYQHVWSDPLHRLPGGPAHINDPIQMLWNLKWVPWRLWHGHNPFATTAIDFPHGISLSWNTAVPTLGIAAAPLTFGVSVIFAFAVLLVVGPALTTLTGYWWLRRHNRSDLASVVGGCVIGFGPFMTGHMLGQINLTFAVLIPVILMLLEDLLWRHPRPDTRTACYLGFAAAGQAGISEELLLITAIAVVVAALAALAVARQASMRALRTAAAPGLRALAIFAVVASPLLVDQLFLSTAVHLQAKHWRATIGDYLEPFRGQLIDPQLHHLSYLGQAEDGVYVGPVLALVLLGGVVLTARRDRAVRVAAAVLAVMMVFTFGDATLWGIRLPWSYLEQLPVLTSILPARLSFASDLAIAWLLAHWIEVMRDRATRGAPTARRAAWAGIVAIAAALLTVVPRPIGAITPPPARFFTAAHIRSLLPPLSAVLLLPAPTPFDAIGMYDQQAADFSFVQPGGYDLRPAGDQAEYGPPPSPLIDLDQLAEADSPTPPGLLAAGRRQLDASDYEAIVVVPGEPGSGRFGLAARMTRLAMQLTGRAADRTEFGVEIWMLDGPKRT